MTWVETTLVGCTRQGLAAAEMTAHIRPGEPSVGALSGKARSNRQISHLLWVVSVPKKEEGLFSMSRGRSVQGGKRSEIPLCGS